MFLEEENLNNINFQAYLFNRLNVNYSLLKQIRLLKREFRIKTTTFFCENFFKILLEKMPMESALQIPAYRS